jgi:hypothetical protein
MPPKNIKSATNVKSSKKLAPRRSNIKKSPISKHVILQYQFMRDCSWLEDAETSEGARRKVERSLMMSGSVEGVPCLWADDLKAEFYQKNPNREPPDPTSKKDRTCNSFIHYRMLVRNCFTGPQTEISKEVRRLWRNESKEMYFYCQRNAEIETRISPWGNELTLVLGETNCTPPIETQLSAHAIVRALPPTLPREHDDSVGSPDTTRVENTAMSSSDSRNSTCQTTRSTPDRLTTPIELEAEPRYFTDQVAVQQSVSEDLGWQSDTQYERGRSVTEITDEFGCPIDFWDSDSSAFDVPSACLSQADSEDLHRVYGEIVW